MFFRLHFFVLLLMISPPIFSQMSFLALSDIHFGVNNPAQDGKDTGPILLKQAMTKMRDLAHAFDFILFLGDIPTHSLFNDPQKPIYLRWIFHELMINDTDKKPLFYIPGNNDSLGGNYQPFLTKNQSPLTYAKGWDGACAFCHGLLIDHSRMFTHGYYISYVAPQTKEIILIVLNATEFTIKPFLPFSIFKSHQQDEAAANQLQWLEQQLKKHHAQQLLIAMHEPPGLNYQGHSIWYPRYTNQFQSLLNSYHKNYQEITLIFSHTHMEELRALYLSDRKTIYGLSVPGISRAHHNFPGMKIVYLNKELSVSNFTTYYTSQSRTWGTQSYQAMGAVDAIFPQCTHENLVRCLSGMNTQQICDAYAKGAFYGVKNPKVSNYSCLGTVNINSPQSSVLR